MCQKPLIKQLTYPLSSIFFQILGMCIWQCCVLCFFLKPVNRFDSLSCMNASTWVQMILLNTFHTLKKILMDLQFSISMSSFWFVFCFCFVFVLFCFFFLWFILWKIGLTSESFKLSGKHQFSNDKLTIFVVIGRCVFSVTWSMSAGMSHTGVTLEPSITWSNLSYVFFCYLLERKLFIALLSFSNLISTQVKNNFFKNVIKSNVRATLIFL